MTPANSTATHTPGPWGLERTTSDNWIGPLRSDGKPDPVICSIEREGLRKDVLARHDADAQLIAAAPELLSALKDVELAINPNDRGGISMHEWGSRLRVATAIALAAIAKAEGR